MMLTGGDTLRRRPPANLPFTLVNNYGPTECTVVSTSGYVSAGPGIPSIGKAISGAQVYVLDEAMRPAQPGESGEIYIGGAGVARGYRNHPELTKPAFVPDPFSSDPKGRMYRSGDRARYRCGGELEFLGRIDEQIKIRGYRIEPNEIVCALQVYPGVKAGAVVSRESTEDDRYLLAYVVVDEGADFAASSLQDFLRERLPDYMIPRRFVRLDSMPYSPSGKVDFASLPEPEVIDRETGVEAPAGFPSLEHRVASILARLLGVSEVRPGDNFFLLGGHSLLAAQVISAIREECSVDLALRSVFEHPTARSLSCEIEERLNAARATERLNA